VAGGRNERLAFVFPFVMARAHQGSAKKYEGRWLDWTPVSGPGGSIFYKYVRDVTGFRKVGGTRRKRSFTGRWFYYPRLWRTDDRYAFGANRFDRRVLGPRDDRLLSYRVVNRARRPRNVLNRSHNDDWTVFLDKDVPGPFFN